MILLCGLPLPQRAPSGPLAQAAQRSVAVSSRIRWSVTGVMAPVCANPATGAPHARKVS